MQAFFHNHKKEIIIGAASAFLVYSFSKLFRGGPAQDQPIKKPYNPLSKQVILDYLSDFKVEILGPLFDIIALREDIKSIYLKNGEEIADSTLRRKIFPDYLASIKKKEVYLYRKHGINSDDLEGSFRDLFSSDAEVTSLKKEIDKSIENALNGISPALDLSPEVLDFLTASRCYELTLEIMTKSLLKIRELYVQLKEEGVTDFSLGNTVVVSRSQALNLKQLKEEILKEKGLEKFQGNPVELFTKAVHRHQDDSKEFEGKIEEIERNYQKLMEGLSKDPEELKVEQIEKAFYYRNGF